MTPDQFPGQPSTTFDGTAFEGATFDGAAASGAVADAGSTRAQALVVLRKLVGRADADFHDGQFEAIEALVDGGRRALVVQRTGWGKSAV